MVSVTEGWSSSPKNSLFSIVRSNLVSVKSKAKAYDQAMAFIAAYDRPDAGPYERHVVQIARTWLRMQGARYPLRALVNRIMEEFSRPVPPEYGCGWAELRRQFTEWAVSEHLWDPSR